MSSRLHLKGLLFTGGLPEGFLDFIKLSPTKMGSWFKMVSVKQSLWTLREAGTKKGRRATGGPLIL